MEENNTQSENQEFLTQKYNKSKEENQAVYQHLISIAKILDRDENEIGNNTDLSEASKYGILLALRSERQKIVSLANDVIIFDRDVLEHNQITLADMDLIAQVVYYHPDNFDNNKSSFKNNHFRNFASDENALREATTGSFNVYSFVKNFYTEMIDVVLLSRINNNIPFPGHINASKEVLENRIAERKGLKESKEKSLEVEKPKVKEEIINKDGNKFKI